jgi:predicted RecA/RadA family phage recombinase
MSKANYVQRGESLDYKNNTEARIEAGDVVVIGSVIGVAGCDIEIGGVGSVHVEGVYKLKKSASGEVAMGAAVYYDGDGITDSASGEAVGYAASAALASDEEIAVKLKG